MQHVLRCWERQSDSSEYKKTLRRLGLRPRPRWGSLQRSRKPPSWWSLSPPHEPHPPLSALRASPLLPLHLHYSKISSDAVACLVFIACWSKTVNRQTGKQAENKAVFRGLTIAEIDAWCYVCVMKNGRQCQVSYSASIGRCQGCWQTQACAITIVPFVLMKAINDWFVECGLGSLV